MPIALDKAEAVALILECCFFGIHTALFLVTLSVLFNKSSTGRTSCPLILTVCSMYLLAITHLSINLYRSVHAFSSNGYVDVPDGSIGFYEKLNHPTEIAKNAVYSLQTILADGFSVWRCYIVWDKRWSVITLPVIMVLGETAVTVGVCWEFSKVQPGHEVFQPALVPWITATFSMTLATNVACTVLIAYRIWRSQRLIKQANMNSTFLPVMVMVIESGVIYSSALVSVIATYASGNNGQYIILDFLTSLIGIVFSLIVVRVGLGISTDGSTSPQPQRTQAVPNFSVALRHDDAKGNYSMKPMAISTSVGG